MCGFGWSSRPLTDGEHRLQLWLQGIIPGLEAPSPASTLTAPAQWEDEYLRRNLPGTTATAYDALLGCLP